MYEIKFINCEVKIIKKTSYQTSPIIWHLEENAILFLNDASIFETPTSGNSWTIERRLMILDE